MFQWRQIPGWDFAHVRVDVIPHILRMLEGTFSLDAARIGIAAVVCGTKMLSSVCVC